jgi:LemA protein
VDPVALAAAFAVGLVVLIAAYLAVATFNAVVGLRLRIDKAWANIDVALHQRYDLLANLVTAVRDLMAFERGVLEEVAKQRSAYSARDPIPRQAETSEATTAAVHQLFAVVERYPELKSADNVLDLQNEIERLEQILAARRELYNDQVYRYNTRIQQVPAVILAWLFGWQVRPFFATRDEVRGRPEAELDTTKA